MSGLIKVEKPWGYELHFVRTNRFAGKVIWIKEGSQLSLQYHEKKDEAFYVQDGLVRAAVGMDVGPEVHRSEAIIAARAPVDPAALRDPSVDLRSLAPAPAP